MTEPEGPDRSGGGVVGFRLSAVERAVTDLRDHVDKRFDAMQGAIGSLQYVSKDVYRSDMARVEEKFVAQAAVSASNRALAMWCLGVVVTTAIAAVIGLLRLAA